ncbi:hypothetical protein HHK36_019628 [Tetracentron sinense]|uniref:Uncharacterized protein n=1 Tax=Tetracentron sinense TaxID=13715 RepID=A0A834Z087_TETSI|nr:hypothetical protein HHK36_019628 [Tetracentron sinense]
MISLILPLAFAERDKLRKHLAMLRKYDNGEETLEKKNDFIELKEWTGEGTALGAQRQLGDGLNKVSVVYRKLRRSVCDEKNLRSTLTKAIYSDGFWALKTCSPQGIWSVREDLQVPSLPYLPSYAQGGQGSPPMVQEHFQSVISQLFQYDNPLRCDGAVDDDMANVIVAQLLYLDAIGPTKI